MLNNFGDNTEPYGIPVLIYFCVGVIVKCCIGFSTFEVVRNKFNYDIWYVSAFDFIYEFVNVNSIKCFTHI